MGLDFSNIPQNETTGRRKYREESVYRGVARKLNIERKNDSVRDSRVANGSRETRVTFRPLFFLHFDVCQRGGAGSTSRSFSRRNSVARRKDNANHTAAVPTRSFSLGLGEKEREIARGRGQFSVFSIYNGGRFLPVSSDFSREIAGPLCPTCDTQAGRGGGRSAEIIEARFPSRNSGLIAEFHG